MYAELYRTLGWIHSTSAQLRFCFSLLGDHIATASDPKPLVKECLLGIAYPNEVLEVQGGQKLRIIGAILLTMDLLGSITRDEIMAGPMSLPDDMDTKVFHRMLDLLVQCRRQKGKLDSVIDTIAKKRGISRSPTMENCTRFPIAVFPWTGWAVKPKLGVLEITETGKLLAARLRNGLDIRLDAFRALPDRVKPALVR
ncbi:MAG TPA: hypothetical protein VJQ25_13010, partial [Nitrospira sp.]|nr:hypothetical protein [Nitrospira sp.]